MKTSTTLKTLRVIGDFKVQLGNLNTSVILNNPAQEILEVRMQVGNLSWEIFRNKIMLQGTVFLNIIYKGTDNNNGIVFHQSESIDFMEHVDVPGLAPGLKLPNKVVLPAQNPEETIDVQIYVSELDYASILTPPFDLELNLLVRLLLKVSRIEQLEVFINGVNGVFRFCSPVTRNQG